MGYSKKGMPGALGIPSHYKREAWRPDGSLGMTGNNQSEGAEPERPIASLGVGSGAGHG